MSSSTQGSTNYFNDQNNVNSTSAEIESSSATASVDPPVQQQRQLLFGSFLDQNSTTEEDEFNILVHDKMGSVSQGNILAPRPAINQHPELNFTLGPNLSLEGYNANSIPASLPAAESPVANSSRANHARGRMLSAGSSSRSGKEVVEGENTAKQNTDSPWLRRPISNMLYDPSYAAIGEPVDPYLRLLKQNPNFCD